ncbi:MAG: hypothetical protein EBQ75_00040 [Actinobacteria bacterium]|nr:hypothetical protein [Actinomycetota bacterium]
MIDHDVVASARDAADRLGVVTQDSAVVSELLEVLPGATAVDVRRVVSGALERVAAIDVVASTQERRLEQLRAALTPLGANVWISGLRGSDITDVASLVDLGRSVTRT